MGQVSQIEDAEERAEQHDELPRYDEGRYAALTPKGKAAEIAERERRKDQKKSWLATKAGRNYLEIKDDLGSANNKIKRLESDLRNKKYEVRVLKRELRKIMSVSGYRPAIEAAKILKR